MPTVLNKKHGMPKTNAVYIGRPSKWGNPFPITAEQDRKAVIDRYQVWLYGQPELVAASRRELAGRDLVCFCAPLPCHGDVLIRVANSTGALPAYEGAASGTAQGQETQGSLF